MKNSFKTNSDRAAFITLEGPEGAGKSTQAAMLKDLIEASGRKCILTREPGGTAIGEEIRKIVKFHAGQNPMSIETETLLFEAARAQLAKELIIPSIEKGIFVVCDRFADSTTVYQGMARKLGEQQVRKLNEFACCGIVPDITFLLDIDPEKGFRRITKRKSEHNAKDRFEEEAFAFHRAVRDGFLKLAAREPDRIKIINADQPPEKIHEKIKELLNEAFGTF